MRGLVQILLETGLMEREVKEGAQQIAIGQGHFRTAEILEEDICQENFFFIGDTGVLPSGT